MSARSLFRCRRLALPYSLALGSLSAYTMYGIVHLDRSLCDSSCKMRISARAKCVLVENVEGKGFPVAAGVRGGAHCLWLKIRPLLQIRG